MAAQGPGRVNQLAKMFQNNDPTLKTATGARQDNDIGGDIGLGQGRVTNGPLTPGYQAPRLPTAAELGMTNEEYANQVAAMGAFQRP
jgi:hypothetical protein